MSIKEHAEKFKFWYLLVLMVIGGGTTFGYTVDRPVWMSEYAPHVQENLEVAGQSRENRSAIIQIQIDALRRSMWELENRMKTHPTVDGYRWLEDQKRQHKRLLERKNKLQK